MALWGEDYEQGNIFIDRGASMALFNDLISKKKLWVKNMGNELKIHDTERAKKEDNKGYTYNEMKVAFDKKSVIRDENGHKKYVGRFSLTDKDGNTMTIIFNGDENITVNNKKMIGCFQRTKSQDWLKKYLGIQGQSKYLLMYPGYYSYGYAESGSDSDSDSEEEYDSIKLKF